MKINFGEKKLGFGVMRLPMLSGDVGDNGIIDTEQTKKMFDEFIDRGFNYFDTAHGYIGGKSEKAVKECLTDRYKRDDYSPTKKTLYHCLKISWKPAECHILIYI